jgi:hypothetical protein
MQSYQPYYSMTSVSFSLRDLDEKLKTETKRILNGPKNVAFVDGEINLAVSVLRSDIPIAPTTVTAERLYGFKIIENRGRTDQPSPRSVCPTKLPNCLANSTRSRQSV